MSEWMGLHNVHKHQPISRKVAAETTQGWLCTENAPCRLCLAAEVEALRAQVQRVRELRDRFRDHEKWASYRRVETLLTRALDGDA